MKYPDDASLSAPPVTGAIIGKPLFHAWMPSTWPKPDGINLPATVGTIFRDSIMQEIDNVINDARGDLRHRGHVVAIGLFCALDAISSYGYEAKDGKQIPDFVAAHFPDEYKKYGKELLEVYRHWMVHNWNLFRASLLPSDEPIKMEDGILCFGLINFRNALWQATEDFLAKLSTEENAVCDNIGSLH